MPRIFTLADPFTREIRYLGRTHNPLRIAIGAFKYFNKNLNNMALKQWLIDLRESGNAPIIEELEVVDSNRIDEHFDFWINQFRFWGFNLINKNLMSNRHELKRRELRMDGVCNILVGTGVFYPPNPPIKMHSKRDTQFRLKTNTCKSCGCEFALPTHVPNLYCSRECRRKSYLGIKRVPFTKERIKLLKEVKYKPIIGVKDGKEHKFPSIEAAAKAIECSQSTISNHLNGRGKTVKGYKFKYDTK